MLEIKLVDAAEVLREFDAPIDLLKLNIEGDEYPVLERLIAEDLLSRVRHLLVQFHLIDDQSARRYTRIAEELARSHDLVWRYPFIWERWDRR